MGACETWKQIPGFKNYDASDCGGIKNNKTGDLISPSADRDGYQCVGLYANTKRKSLFVHRLVLSAFCGGPASGRECNHIDGIKANNKIDNLEWVTHSENMKHAFAIGLKSNAGKNNSMYGKGGLRGEKNPHSKLSDEQRFVVYCFAYLRIYKQAKIASIFNVSVRTVKYILNRYRARSAILN